MEDVFGKSPALGAPPSGHAPKAINRVAMDVTAGAFVPGMIEAEMAVAKIDPPVAAAPAVRVDRRGRGSHERGHSLAGLSLSSPGRFRYRPWPSRPKIPNTLVFPRAQSLPSTLRAYPFFIPHHGLVAQVSRSARHDPTQKYFAACGRHADTV